MGAAQEGIVILKEAGDAAGIKGDSKQRQKLIGGEGRLIVRDIFCIFHRLRIENGTAVLFFFSGGVSVVSVNRLGGMSAAGGGKYRVLNLL